jgi:hypothetical protein
MFYTPNARRERQKTLQNSAKKPGGGASGGMGLAVRGAENSSQPRTMWPETPRKTPGGAIIQRLSFAPVMPLV